LNDDASYNGVLHLDEIFQTSFNDDHGAAVESPDDDDIDETIEIDDEQTGVERENRGGTRAGG
jgi:hypothetical protein